MKQTDVNYSIYMIFLFKKMQLQAGSNEYIVIMTAITTITGTAR